MEKIKIAIADDHVLFRIAVAELINKFDTCTVISQSNNGVELIQSIGKGFVPDIVILDLNMQEMTGIETARWIKKHHPNIGILILTMYDSELSYIQILQIGVKGVLKKDVHPNELKIAIETIARKGYYYSNHTAVRLFALFEEDRRGNRGLSNAILSSVEMEFLKLVCSDMTYKEVAQKMKLNPRAIDTLRDQLFTKLDVKSRVGLAIIALNHGLVNL
jgi:DNA-binding NarL/FixJ family response regulator